MSAGEAFVAGYRVGGSLAQSLVETRMLLQDRQDREDAENAWAPFEEGLLGLEAQHVTASMALQEEFSKAIDSGDPKAMFAAFQKQQAQVNAYNTRRAEVVMRYQGQLGGNPHAQKLAESRLETIHQQWNAFTAQAGNATAMMANFLEGAVAEKRIAADDARSQREIESRERISRDDNATRLQAASMDAGSRFAAARLEHELALERETAATPENRLRNAQAKLLESQVEGGGMDPKDRVDLAKDASERAFNEMLLLQGNPEARAKRVKELGLPEDVADPDLEHAIGQNRMSELQGLASGKPRPAAPKRETPGSDGSDPQAELADLDAREKYLKRQIHISKMRDVDRTAAREARLSPKEIREAETRLAEIQKRRRALTRKQKRKTDEAADRVKYEALTPIGEGE